jgi:hypothetical protein
LKSYIKQEIIMKNKFLFVYAAIITGLTAFSPITEAG